MNAFTTGWRLVSSLVLGILLVSPTSAQLSRISGDIENSLDSTVESVFENAAPSDLSILIDNLRDTELLPLAPPALSGDEWGAYGEKLETALGSGHRGLQHAALRLVIAYGEQFDLSESAVFDVMRIYRDGDTERVRRMAVVTLAEMNSEWAMKFLERSVRFEKSEPVRRTIQAVLYNARRLGPAL